MTTATFTNKNTGSIEKQIIDILNKAGIKGMELDFSGATRSYGRTETTFKIVATVKGNVTRKDAGLAPYLHANGIDIDKKGRKGEQIFDYRPKASKHKLIYKTKRGAEYIIGADDWKNRIL